MADKSNTEGSTRQPQQRKSWTDGLPHDFRGWGPQTPDPDLHADEDLAHLDEDLTWKGEPDYRNHYIWRFDGRRHHHH